jgi:PadR family transcriptional regulator, regulatory protein AphA
MARENKSRYALLGMLSLRPMSGYDLKKQIECTTAHFWKEDIAQIYPMLKQLEAEGLTTSAAEKQEGRPERRIYALTDQGWEALRDWITKPVAEQVKRNELLLKLFFASHVPVAVSVEHVQQYRATQQGALATLEQLKQSLQQQPSKRTAYWLMTISYGIHHLRALIAWCDETLEQLAHLDDNPADGTLAASIQGV